MKKTFTKNCIMRALRTFLQTAIGYAATNVALYLGGMDYGNGDMLKNAAVGLAISAISAGLAAVMNMEQKEDSDSDTDKSKNTE